MRDVFEILGPDGPFAQKIDDFVARPMQQEMAQCVSNALSDRECFISEAGTGTGKTFAYLVPALLSGKKVIISTGTKNLQDQLFYKDLPLVARILGVSRPVSLLKGRSNYFCHYRFEQKQYEGRLSDNQQQEFWHIKQWLQRTRSGDITEIKQVTENSTTWPLVTSTADNCLGSDCPNINECFVVMARKKAQESDIVVINHHLFFADMTLREEGFGEVLPGADGFIFDEAHQLPDTATLFFGRSVSSRQLLDLGRDTELEVLRDAPDNRETLQLSGALKKLTRDFRLSLDNADQRSTWEQAVKVGGVDNALVKLTNVLVELEQQLKQDSMRGTGLEKCWRRALQIRNKLQAFAHDAMPTGCPDDSPENTGPDQVQWYETSKRGFILHQTPIQIAEQFSKYVNNNRSAWIFASATLSVNGSFKHFTQALGIEAGRSKLWDSPFDYKQQALLYVPRNMLQPGSPRYIESVSKIAESTIKASKGRMFILVTSYKALHSISRYLKNRIDYPLLVQGESAKTEILQQFRQLGNAVLVGTSSFWEGVDVKGEALSCVIIDKLPFSAPDDPVLQARIESMQSQGFSPFKEIQLPKAVITLKQGVGRLIRDINDTGVLIICDPRLYTKPYGKIFLRSLPPVTQTRDFPEVIKFFSREIDEVISA